MINIILCSRLLGTFGARPGHVAEIAERFRVAVFVGGGAKIAFVGCAQIPLDKFLSNFSFANFL
jgi:hypothetical protein